MKKTDPLTEFNFDALQFKKHMNHFIKIDDKDAIIHILVEEISMLNHFLAHKNEEYLEFRNKVKNVKIIDDDLLEWSLNPPSIPEGTVIPELPRKEHKETFDDIWNN